MNRRFFERVLAMNPGDFGAFVAFCDLPTRDRVEPKEEDGPPSVSLVFLAIPILFDPIPLRSCQKGNPACVPFSERNKPTFLPPPSQGDSHEDPPAPVPIS